MHALRHFYASVLHADPAMTLRVYTHLMPSSRERARRAPGRASSAQPRDPDDAAPALNRTGAGKAVHAK